MSESVAVERVSNGFIVRPERLARHESTPIAENVHVFESHAGLESFLKEYFGPITSNTGGA